MSNSIDRCTEKALERKRRTDRNIENSNKKQLTETSKIAIRNVQIKDWCQKRVNYLLLKQRGFLAVRSCEPTSFYLIILGAKLEKTKNNSQIIEKAQEAANDIPLFQVVDAAQIAGKEHLLSSFWHAFRHFNAGRKISSHLSLEVLLYAAGGRQIHQAISSLGIQDSTQAIGLIAGSPDLLKLQKIVSNFINAIEAKRDDTVLEITPSKMKCLAEALEKPDIPVDQTAILRRVAETVLANPVKSTKK